VLDLFVKFVLCLNILCPHCGDAHWAVWLLVLVHRAMKNVKCGIRYIANFFYIMECRRANVLFEAPVNFVIGAESSCCQDFYSIVIMRSVCLWLCIDVEWAEL